jgi:uncharacterized protein YdiU (UPF0061 family)
MIFQSDAEMIRHYFKELLSDGEEHSLPDVIEYVKQKHGETGIAGNELSYSTFNNAIRSLLRPNNREYATVRRGVFKMGVANQENVIDAICKNMSWILIRTESDIRDCFVKHLDITEMSMESIHALQETSRDVFALLNQATQAVNDFQNRQREEMQPSELEQGMQMGGFNQ